MIEFKHNRIRLTAIDTWVLQKVLQQVLVVPVHRLLRGNTHSKLFSGAFPVMFYSGSVGAGLAHALQAVWTFSVDGKIIDRFVFTAFVTSFGTGHFGLCFTYG